MKMACVLPSTPARTGFWLRTKLVCPKQPCWGFCLARALPREGRVLQQINHHDDLLHGLVSPHGLFEVG